MKHRIFTKSRIIAAAIIIVVGAAVFLLRPSKKIRHVVLISIDTCRSDYLSCYGYPRKTTPNIDKLAAKGILFKNAYSPVPLTLPSHSSMMTGTIPPYHGVHDNSYYQLGKSNVTLAEILKDNGFSTAAFIGAVVLNSQFGLDQGFDTYNDRFPKEHGTAVHFHERIGGETTELAIQWLTHHKPEKSFLFLHYFDPHALYDPPEPFRSQYSRNLYAGEIAYTDHCIGQVIAKLKELGIYDSSLIIITADHGEMFGEHGEDTHGYYIYQSAIKVPLIFKLPGKLTGRKIAQTAGLIDIVPTVCSLLDIAAPNNIQGKDLAGYFGKKQPAAQDRYLYCESLTPTQFNANSLLGLVGDRFKYIQTTRAELYDIVLDPQEGNDLIKAQPNRARILQNKLKEVLDNAVTHGKADSKLEMDAETRKRIESLGYVAGAGVKEEFEFNQDKSDPKDMLDFCLSHIKVATLMSENKYVEAKELCKKLVQVAHPTFVGYSHMGIILNELGEFDESVEYLKKALKMSPDHSEARKNLVVALLKQEKFDEAEDVFFEKRNFIPSKEKLHKEWAMKMAAEGQLDKAVDHLRKTVELNPDSPDSDRLLALGLFDKGQFKEAMKYFKKALRLDPDDEALFAAGNALTAKFIEQDKYDQAVELCSAVLEIKPDHLDTLNDLAWIKAVYGTGDIGSAKEAVELAHHACELTGYSNPQLLDTLAAAYAAAGQFEDAIKTCEKAIKLAANQAQLAEEFKTRLELYKQNKPYRQ